MIKNFLFDFGVVLYDVDATQTHRAFEALGMLEAEHVFTVQRQNQWCDWFEAGKMSETDFFDQLHSLVAAETTREQLQFAWQAMLVGLPQAKKDFIMQLRETYQVMVLSNTNPAHMKGVNNSLAKDHGLSSIHDLFDRCYLSFECGLRKPDERLFRHVIEHAGIDPAETYFIDDLAVNVEAAKKLGMQALLYKPGMDLLSCLPILKR